MTIEIDQFHTTCEGMYRAWGENGEDVPRSLFVGRAHPCFEKEVLVAIFGRSSAGVMEHLEMIGLTPADARIMGQKLIEYADVLELQTAVEGAA